ncbi:MAG: molybdopterin oxidoreductase family protein [Thermomicrobiales bacterium]|nr:molybdopterin oxidoreductase family protein [Thermomicrobiales bacterium]
MTEPRLIRGACPHDCPDTCATLSEVHNGRVVRFVADPDHPITQGWLCAKVRPYLERVYADDRLMYPLRRKGPKGSDRWERITWDEAIDEIAGRWKAIIAEDGAQAILPYSYSGTLGLVENMVAATRFWNRMGACGLERSICDAAATTASIATIGGKLAPDPRDVAHTKTILIWGHNPASTNPHFMPFLREAQRNGTYVVVIDPRRTVTAKSADLYLQVKPATDAALALGLMHVIFRDGLHDPDWLDAHSIGWQELRERTAHFSPEKVAVITGIDAETIESLARRFAAESPAMIKFSDGVQRHENGGQTIRALLCLPALTGQYGVRGGGIFYSQSSHIVWDEEAMGKASECPPVPRIVNMNRLGASLTGEVSDPPIRSLYVFIANPVTSTPNAGATVQGLMREDLFTVVHEQFMTDTARYADIVLPATSQLERDDLHKAYGHRHLQYNHAAVPPPGECRGNWQVMQDLAAAMGYDDPWLKQSTTEVIEEILEATKTGNTFLEGITLERLQDEGTVAYSVKPDEDVPFAGGRFRTASGKIELRCDAMLDHGVDPLPDYKEPLEYGAERNQLGDLVLISGAAHHFVSSSFGNQPSLQAKEGRPQILINPTDALRLGIADRSHVEVYNQRGSCELIARVTDETAPGVAVSPKGQWGQSMPGKRGLNWLTSDRLADLGGQSTFHSTMVSVRPVRTIAATLLESVAVPAD